MNLPLRNAWIGYKAESFHAAREAGTDEDAVEQLAAATERLKVYQETQGPIPLEQQQGEGHGEN